MRVEGVIKTVACDGNQVIGRHRHTSHVSHAASFKQLVVGSQHGHMIVTAAPR